MAHWKKFMDKELLGAHDLDGRDVTVVILEVSGGEINNGTKKNKKPIATLGSRDGRRLEKRLALNATNCKTIEQLTGSPDVDKWRGVPVVLFPTTTNFGGQTVDCVRIRPYPPKDDNRRGNGGSGRKGSAPAAAASEQPSSDATSESVVPRDAEGDESDVPSGEQTNA